MEVQRYTTTSSGAVGRSLAVIILYFFHMSVLTQHQLVFPFQLLPNDRGHFASIGFDSLAGMAVLVAYVLRDKPRSKGDFPWHVPKQNIRFRITSLLTAIALIQAYFWTGRFSLFWEDTIYTLSGLGFYITAPMKRSLSVLAGHLSWVAVGAALLQWLPRPPKFFGSHHGDKEPGIVNIETQEPETNYRWLTSRLSDPTLWLWTIGGYYVSSWLFNIADGVNQYILPAQVLLDAQESVVTQLVNPEHNDIAASVVGYLAPCVSAPWWEEVLYRGFCLPVLTQILGYTAAVIGQGILFSAHHLSLTAALPLAVLGWTWALLYRASGNLWSVVFVHALWNSRVFLGSWLGL